VFIKKNKGKKKVAIGLSGGVDSSVAAYLLKEQGFEVVGVYMQCWDEKADGCVADVDRSFAVATAASLGIKFIHLDFKDRYKSKVIDYFYSEYEHGRTPNPDVLCNKEIKFGLFYDWALEKGYDFVATGHYARVETGNNEILLKRGIDESKDQSYFLYLLEQRHLEKVIFPVGNHTKAEIREIAKNTNLPPAKRPESMGICFIGEVDIKDFLKKRIEERKGEVIFKDGENIGEHDGVWFYTIGQRHGFRVNKYFGTPLYVLSKDMTRNTLTVGRYDDALSEAFEISDIHWIGKNYLSDCKDLKCDVRIRHLGEIINCNLVMIESGFRVELTKPVFAVAPGQSAVFYKDDVVLGGGVIV
jgi:tRNA-specific 2-thiouridylase